MFSCTCRGPPRYDARRGARRKWFLSVPRKNLRDAAYRCGFGAPTISTHSALVVREVPTFSSLTQEKGTTRSHLDFQQNQHIVFSRKTSSFGKTTEEQPQATTNKHLSPGLAFRCVSWDLKIHKPPNVDHSYDSFTLKIFGGIWRVT